MIISELIKKQARPFYSLEFFPPKEESHMDEFFKAANALKEMNPLFVSVTYGAGGSRQANTLEVACTLKKRFGFEPMTHLTCVGSRRQAITEYLAKLRNEGIDNVLALRGDAPKTQTPDAPPYDWSADDFQHASDLVEFIKAGFPEFCVGVAAYPAPHPESASRETDLYYTKFKVDAGGCFLVTQLFFDINEYKTMVQDLRALGVDKPIIPGVMPVQSLESLDFVMRMCGATIPPAYRRELTNAGKIGGPKAVREVGVEYAAWQIKSLIKADAPGVHLYTLNKSETCLRIAKLVGEL